MKTLLEKIIILIAVLCFTACLPDSSTKWDKNKSKTATGSSGTGGADPTPTPPVDENGDPASISALNYAQDIILIKLNLTETASGQDTDNSSSAFTNLFQADGVFNPGSIDGIALNRNIPKNANAISTTLFNGEGIYVTSAKDAKGNFARGIVTGINSTAKYVYLKVLQGSFNDNDSIDINYNFYFEKVKITEVIHIFTKDTTITPMSPTLSPLGFTGLSFTVSPKLPTGLTLNYSTGIISGTPTSVSKGQYTLAVRESNGSSITKVLRISVTTEPRGLGIASNVILVVGSTDEFSVGSYVSASINMPTTATGEAPRSHEFYPWGVVKEIISSTKMLVQVKNGKFLKNDILDNARKYENTETLVNYDPLPVSAVLSLNIPVAAYKDLFHYDIESASTPKTIYAVNWIGAIGSPAVFTKSVEGKGIVIYYHSNPPAGSSSKMYVLTTYGNFAKGLPIYDNWDATSASTALGTISFVKSDTVTLGLKAGYCRHGGGTYTTRTSCIANSINTTCDLGYADSKTCRAKGGIWTPDYYAWIGIENFSAGMDVSNNPAGPVANCDLINSCKGTGFVSYKNTSARELDVRVSNDAFGSDYSGTGESVDNLNIYNASTGPVPGAKGLVGMVMTTSHFDLYTDEYFSTTVKLFEGENVTFSITPDLPEGLELNGETGVISGTPTINAIRNTYTLTAHSGNSDIVESLTFSMTVHGHMTIFAPKIDSYYPRSYIMHRLGRGNHHQECRLTNDQIKFGRSPEDPEITTTRRIACFLEVQEEELFVNGFTLGAYMSPGNCEYLHYRPYSFYEWKYIKSYPGTTQEVLPGGGIVKQHTFVRLTNGCMTLGNQTTGLQQPDGTFITAIAGGSLAVYTNTSTGRWVASSEASIKGEGDYSPVGPNCDDGSYNVEDHTYSEVTDAADNVTCNLTVTSTNKLAGGSQANCITGPLRKTETLNPESLYGTVIVSVNNQDQAFTKEWKYGDLIHENTLGDTPISIKTSKLYANYVAKNSCANGLANYATPNQFQYYFDSWIKYANNYHPSDYTTMIDPFKGSQPFYHFTCANAAMDPKAEIFVMVREWDRAFNPITNITDPSNTLYNQEIDQLFPGASLPIPALDSNNFNHYDHLQLSHQDDPVDYQPYDDFHTWDTYPEKIWTMPGASNVNEYNSCFQDFSISTKAVIGAQPPTTASEYFAFPQSGN
ncbi:MAG: hypothetical protein A2381_09940 [Bdellovibrionales bacterium RIFOXYB1_FULL_37_110]|nr:MAG: hypothetical protein A2181_03020 [Bdellovibrionales bacterium RIFOXYA1_FULL_38_20]OFZ48913.1 MAG: hypothetical protein A2417_08400 [Bdellovibrionales bacterium RIFOXYC1_FULL_37_79]OFZ59590.1 MAG: hypothetical protein A2381_09940 [Bdellovibrionales bacterium RIFOXYB1_FULL_37_110]OFZ62431.1 MAG: hypothetical protein A2577_03315 [Bdellovibrionales bacterium RIFOXYD1_FULL_36_51]